MKCPKCKTEAMIARRGGAAVYICRNAGCPMGQKKIVLGTVAK